MTTLSTIRAALRADLRDINAAAYKWNDDELNRFIQRAATAYSLAAPLMASVTVAALADGAEYDHTALTDWLYCWRVEYPLDQQPRRCLVFEEVERGKVCLLSPTLPEVGEQLRFWYARQHTLDENSSTLPQWHEHLVTLGAAAYALLAFADYSVGRVTPTDKDVTNYRELGAARQEDFRNSLSALSRENALLPAPVSVHWAATNGEV